LINNRQNGRRRGRGGQRPQGNPGQPGGGGNRIDNRARGNAQQLHEKYRNLAQDAQRAGDRVTTEYYLQFADHYFRVLNESRARFEEQRPPRQDGDEEFDGDENSADEFQAREPRRDRNERQDRGDRNGYRRDEERRDRQPERAEDGADEDRSEAEPRSQEGQRRERRPRRSRDEAQPQGEAFDADRLPPAIAVDSGEGEEAPAPRRRGRRPRAEIANDTAEVPPAA